MLPQSPTWDGVQAGVRGRLRVKHQHAAVCARLVRDEGEVHCLIGAAVLQVHRHAAVLGAVQVQRAVRVVDVCM